MKNSVWFILLAALLLAACSKDSEQTVTPGPEVPRPDTIPTPAVEEAPLSLVAATRGDGSGFYDASDAYEVHSPIQFFLMSGANETAINQKREGLFVYDPEKAVWSSNIGLKEPHNCIYGFSPATAASCVISPAVGSSYKEGAVLKMTNLTAASGSDLCVIIGVRHGSSKAETEAVPVSGQYYFMMASRNYVSLLLDHVFARIDFKVKLGTEYSKLRYIKIKKLELQSSFELTGMTVRLTPTSTDISYETTPSADGTPQTGVIYDFSTDADNPEGKDITVDGTVFPGFFAPDDASQIAKALSLVCTYDVYAIDAFNDNKIGTRVRENCVAVNSLAGMAALASMRRGKKTSLTLTVEPTYLYQLSEDELDNPTIVVKGE